jgi:hypothetical protein
MTYLKTFVALAFAFSVIDVLLYKDDIVYGIELGCVIAGVLVSVLAIWNLIRNSATR